MTSAGIEIELKLRVDDLQPVRERLSHLEAEFIGRYLEHNTLLDRSDGALQRAGEGLRLREVQTLAGRPLAPTMTYKGPVQPSAFKKRPEIEITVSEAAEATALLGALGFHPVVSFLKRRERWSLDGCLVELDELPLLGDFVEIEGPDESAIAAARTRLKLSRATQEKAGYVRLLAEACEASGRSTLGIVFP